VFRSRWTELRSYEAAIPRFPSEYVFVRHARIEVDAWMSSEQDGGHYHPEHIPASAIGAFQLANPRYLSNDLNLLLCGHVTTKIRYKQVPRRAFGLFPGPVRSSARLTRAAVLCRFSGRNTAAILGGRGHIRDSYFSVALGAHQTRFILPPVLHFCALSTV